MEIYPNQDAFTEIKEKVYEDTLTCEICSHFYHMHEKQHSMILNNS